jgi:hypothetical protein
MMGMVGAKGPLGLLVAVFLAVVPAALAAKDTDVFKVQLLLTADIYGETFGSLQAL